jgi:hypothetical protein
MQQVPKEVVVHHILRYLKWSEVIILLSSSSEIFSEVRYGTLHFRIHVNDIEDQVVESLRQKLSSNEQLRIKGFFSGIQKDKWEKVLQINECSLFVEQLIDEPSLIFLRPILAKRIQIDNFDIPLDLAKLSHLQEVELINSCSLKNINSLGNVQKLTIIASREVVDISGLGNIPELFVSSCQEIRDISALMNNRKLTIMDCENIDISTANFENIQHLRTDLSLTYESTITLRKAQSLEIDGLCISSIFLAKTVKSVDMGFPPQVSEDLI